MSGTRSQNPVARSRFSHTLNATPLAAWLKGRHLHDIAKPEKTNELAECRSEEVSYGANYQISF